MISAVVMLRDTAFPTREKDTSIQSLFFPSLQVLIDMHGERVAPSQPNEMMNIKKGGGEEKEKKRRLVLMAHMIVQSRVVFGSKMPSS